MCDFFSLATPGVQGLSPYQPGKPLEELEREYGIQNAIKLASNENPLGPSPRALEALRQQCSPENIAGYPDGGGFRLKHSLSQQLGVTPQHITLGNGSNDILDIIARVFAAPDVGVMFSQHAFAIYALATQAIGAKAQEIPAKAWGHDLSAMRKGLDDTTRIIFIANPNNPTGTWVDDKALKAFIESVPQEVIIVLDEAYFEYVKAADYPNSLPWLAQHPNLIIVRTFSKAYGLAGLRVGYSVSHPDVADLLNRVRQPFNVNSMALLAAEIAIQDQSHLEQVVALNESGMQQLSDAFTQMGLDFIPSVGNFICVDMQRSGVEVYEKLLRKGVIVRPVANYGLPTHLRISIGAEHENQQCIEALRSVLS